MTHHALTSLFRSHIHAIFFIIFFLFLFFAGVVKSRLEATNGGLPLEAALCYESYADVRNPNDS